MDIPHLLYLSIDEHLVCFFPLLAIMTNKRIYRLEWYHKSLFEYLFLILLGMYLELGAGAYGNLIFF